MNSYIIGALLLFLISWFLVPYALRRIAERRLAKMCRTKRAVALTYDDGPGRKLTPQLLDLLAREGVHATFFALGRSTVTAPDIISRTVAEGHLVGSHTVTHANAWKTNPLTFHRDMMAGMQAINQAGGSGGDFRPPFGKMTLASLVAAAASRIKLGWWTIDSQDSWDRRPIDDVMAQIAEQGGGVILMHDLDQYKSAPDEMAHPDYVLELTQRIISYAKANDMQILRMNDLT